MLCPAFFDFNTVSQRPLCAAVSTRQSNLFVSFKNMYLLPPLLHPVPPIFAIFFIASWFFSPILKSSTYDCAHLPSCQPPGKSNPYCEVTMGAQVFTSRTLNDTLNPKWNFNCQFHIRDLYQDVLCITILEKDQFSPDGQLNICFFLPLSYPQLCDSGAPHLCYHAEVN